MDNDWWIPVYITYKICNKIWDKTDGLIADYIINGSKNFWKNHLTGPARSDALVKPTKVFTIDTVLVNQPRTLSALVQTGTLSALVQTGTHLALIQKDAHSAIVKTNAHLALMQTRN